MLRKVYIGKLFYVLFFSTVLLLGISSFVDWLYFPSIVALVSLLLLTLLDALLIFIVKHPLNFERRVNQRLNLGDKNTVTLHVSNNNNLGIRFVLYDGYPVDLQLRDLSFKSYIAPHQSVEFHYEIEPKKRGILQFNNAFFILSSIFRLVSRRYEVKSREQVAVYPSYLQLRKYELLVFHQQKTQSGIKRIRRLGNNSEFEQIKNYVQGDEVKTINWKATSRTANLMVNKYQEEKSQNIYCILDKSRTMQMEFDQLSLLDYSINSILALSNILLKNGDKAGLISFSDNIGAQIPAEKRNSQMHLISEALYNQETTFKSPNYEVLNRTIRRTIKTRSLLLMFTNFESEEAFERALPTLIQLNQKHILVVILFQNSDLELLAQKPAESMFELYKTIISEQMIGVKEKIVLRLRQNGIKTILTLPENLSVNSINMYLELKARGVL